MIVLASVPDVHAQLRGLGAPPSIGGIGAGPPAGLGLPRNDPPGVPSTGNLPPPLPSPSGSITDPVTGTLRDSTITNTLEGNTRLPSPKGIIDGAKSTAKGNLPKTGKQATKASRVPPPGERRFVANEVLLGLPSSLSEQALNGLAKRHRLTRLEAHRLNITGTTFHRWQITDGRSVADVVRALEADAGIRIAQPNYQFTLQQAAKAAVPDRVAQYSLTKLRVPEAHRLATGANVLVALIDNGVDTTHPEIAHAIAGSFDAIGAGEPPSLHGTAMAGAIVAQARLVGIAPTARILAIRAFAASPSGHHSTTLAILRGIDWAVARGARVINMSFAGPYDPEISNSLAAASRKGIVLVAAAGNAGPNAAPLYPAADPNVIAVTAVDDRDELFVRSVRGKHIALAAPGVDVVGPAPGGLYQVSTGTSVAAAHVSGIAALLIELRPRLTPRAVRNLLLSTARDLGAAGRDSQFGAGLADAYRAAAAVNAPAQASKQKSAAR